MLSLIRNIRVTVKPTAKPAGAGWGSLSCVQLSLLSK